MPHFKKIVGEHVYLSPLCADDTELITKWVNDPVMGEMYLTFPTMYSVESKRDALNERAKSDRFEEYAIVRLEDDALIGKIDLHDFNHSNRSAWLGVFIGESENRNRGYGTEAVRLMLKFGFDWFNLHGIGLSCFADNSNALACYRKVGFREYGRRRDGVFKNGAYCDVIYMDILEHEFRQS